jgi:small subunit ribosomal protein S3
LRKRLEKQRRRKSKMEEKKFVKLKKDEFKIKEYIKKALGKGRVSNVYIEYTPIGEKIIISTSRPGYVIGRKGEKIAELTELLKRDYKLENPAIEIKEIEKPEFDAQTIADEIAIFLERFGSLKFKVAAYKMLQRIRRAGALGAEIRLSGKLPSERAKSWRFSEGYLKKTGETAKIVERAQAVANTMAGTIGVKVDILPPDRKIHDKIEVNAEMNQKIQENRLKLIENDSTKKKRN